MYSAPDTEGEFYCPIQTSWFGNDERVEAIFGVDAFQALELAMRYVGWRLSAITARAADACVGSSVTMVEYQRNGNRNS